MHRRIGALVACLAGLVLAGPWASRAHAQGLQVSPIRIELQPGQQTTTMTVVNQGGAAVSVQLRAFQWDQSGPTEALKPTNALAVSPPIIDIAPGASQIFRVLLRTPPTDTEASYRLLLDQLPGSDALPGQGIRLLLRSSIPLFAKSAARMEPNVTWHVVLQPGGPVLVGVNRGSGHIQVVNPILTEAGGRSLPVQQGQTPYILPGAERQWSVRDGGLLRPGATVHLTAASDKGPLDVKVDVIRP